MIDIFFIFSEGGQNEANAQGMEPQPDAVDDVGGDDAVGDDVGGGDAAGDAVGDDAGDDLSSDMQSPPHE